MSMFLMLSVQIGIVVVLVLIVIFAVVVITVIAVVTSTATPIVYNIVITSLEYVGLFFPIGHKVDIYIYISSGKHSNIGRRR